MEPTSSADRAWVELRASNLRRELSWWVRVPCLCFFFLGGAWFADAMDEGEGMSWASCCFCVVVACYQDWRNRQRLRMWMATTPVEALARSGLHT